MAINFKEGRWNHEINVTDFVKTNITPYEGDASFLAGPTERTKAVWNKCLEALAEEQFRIIELPMRPTAENLAKYFYEYMADKGYQVIRTTVYETPTNAATYMA